MADPSVARSFHPVNSDSAPSPDVQDVIMAGAMLGHFRADRFLPEKVDAEFKQIALSLLRHALSGERQNIERIIETRSTSIHSIWDALLNLYRQATEQAEVQESDAALPLPNGEEVYGWPRPDRGTFCRDFHNSLVLRWKNDRRGENFLARTNGFLVFGHRADASWLPSEWAMDTFPCGWTRQHLEHWFDYVIAAVKGRELQAREAIRHVDLILKHLGIADSPPRDARKPVERLQVMKTFVLSQLTRPATVAKMPKRLVAPDSFNALVDWFAQRVEWFRTWFYAEDAEDHSKLMLPEQYVDELVDLFPKDHFNGHDRQKPAKGIPTQVCPFARLHAKSQTRHDGIL